MMAADVAAIANPGTLKANKRNPEKLLDDFNLYVEYFTKMLTVTDTTAASSKKRKLF